MAKDFTHSNRNDSFTMLKVAIWSVSVLTSITGLAISPSLPAIQAKFPGVSQMKADMLISLPNLLLIPFVIIVGKLAQSKGSVMLIRLGCLIFLLCAIGYQFAHNFFYLLLISVVLGIGAGFVVPLAAQLPGVAFQGAQRQKQMGICSGISNAAQVFCTFLAGWLATVDWHASFWVYAIALIPLLLSPFLRISKLPQQAEAVVAANEPDPSPGKDGINRKGLFGLMSLYFIVMFFNLQIPLNLPFLLEGRHLDTTIGGSLVAVFFMVQALTAFVINNMIRIFRTYTMVFVLLVISICLLLFPMVTEEIWYYVLAAGAGVTGGTIEPLIWNKTSTLTTRRQSTVAFGWLMSACYLSIWATPYLTNMFARLLHDDKHTFPFVVSGILSLAFTLFLFFRKEGTIFGMKNEVSLFETKHKA